MCIQKHSKYNFINPNIDHIMIPNIQNLTLCKWIIISMSWTSYDYSIYVLSKT